MTRLAVQTAARAGAMDLLTDYCAAASLKMQLYRARPTQIKTPSAWPERLSESLVDFTTAERQRVVRVTVKVVWGVYDSGSTVDQRDAFVDGFLDYVADNPHGFGANTLVDGVSVDDDPSFTPEWIPTDSNVYFASDIVLEGFAST